MSRSSHLGPELIAEGKLPVTVDIVLVHGLMGHPFNTWSSETTPEDDSTSSPFWRKLLHSKVGKSAERRPIFWPRDFLPKSLPHARIFTYGYEAQVVDIFSSASQNSVYSISRDLVVDIELQRESESEQSRPIIWIAHSLGGIVVKDALIQSNALELKAPHLYSIYRASKGIIYLGTPHRGSDAATFGLIAASAAQALLQTPNKNLLRTLKAGSNELERIADAFSLLPSKTNKSLLEYSFQEDRGMASALPLIGGKIVPDSSSRLDDGAGSTSSIAANHRDMGKFSNAKNRDFIRLQGVLRRFAQTATRGEPNVGNLQNTSDNQDTSSHPDEEVDTWSHGQMFSDEQGLTSSSGRLKPRYSGTFDSEPGTKLGIPRAIVREAVVGRSNGFTRLQPQTYQLKTPDHKADSRYTVKHRRVTIRVRFFELPLLDNRFFTGRKSHLQRIHEVLKPQVQEELYETPPDSLSCVLLIGLGGCGKTEIALRYAREHRNEYTAVIWLDGTSRDTLELSMSRVSAKFPGSLKLNRDDLNDHRSKRDTSFDSRASRIDLPGDLTRHIERQKPFEILSWLQNPSNPYSWLLVIDNMDDPKMADVIEDMLSLFARGAILITTRNQRSSMLGIPIQVAEMEPEEARYLLQASVGSAFKGKNIDSLCGTLVDKLGYLALAIDQAAAYIKYHQMSLEEYISLFEEEEEYLLSQSARHRYHKTKDSDDTVLKTWEISFRFIKKTHANAAALLRFLAFLNPEDISESMFEEFQRQKVWSRWTSAGVLELVEIDNIGLQPTFCECLVSRTRTREAIGTLLSLSLLRRKADTRSLSMHPLVHFWASSRMDPEERVRWIGNAVTFLGVLIPATNQLPPIDGDTNPGSFLDGVSTHIQILYELSLEMKVVDFGLNMVWLLGFGSYYVDHLTSHRMYATVKDICHSKDQSNDLDFQRLLTLNWSLAKVCTFRKPCCTDAHIPVSEALRILKDQSKSSIRATPGINALLLRLAFVCGRFLEEQLYDKPPVKLFDFDMPPTNKPQSLSEFWVPLHRPPWQGSSLVLVREFVGKWTPIVEMNSEDAMEKESKLLRTLFVQGISDYSYDIFSTEQAEKELLNCAEVYLPNPAFQATLLARLAALAISSDRSMDVSLTSIQRLLNFCVQLHPMPTRVLSYLAPAIGTVCTRWNGIGEKQSCELILQTAKQIERNYMGFAQQSQGRIEGSFERVLKNDRSTHTIEKSGKSEIGPNRTSLSGGEEFKWKQTWDEFLGLWQDYGTVKGTVDDDEIQKRISKFLGVNSSYARRFILSELSKIVYALPEDHDT